MRNPYAAPLAPMPSEMRHRNLPSFSGWWPVGWGALAGLVMRLFFWGEPEAAYAAMLGSFILGSPLLVGAVTVYMAERQQRRSWSYYIVAPAFATLLYVAGTLAILIEGWICAIVILPLFAFIGALAGLAMGVVCRLTNWPRHAIVSSVAVLPLLTGAFEHRLPLPNLERRQERTILVAAPAAEVWRQLVDARDIQPEELEGAWMYRIGVPLPLSGTAGMRDGRHLRHIAMGKGIRFDQVASEWLPGQAVTWNYEFAADSFPPHALDDHVRIGGHYFDLGTTRYSLRERPDGTELSVRMHYRVSTRFNWYAGPVADFLVGNFEENILRFYARRVARQGAPAAVS